MISDYLVDKLLNKILGGVDFTPPTDIYIGLVTSAPLSTGLGGTEVTGGSYGRVAKTNNATNFPDTGTDREKVNGTTITFPTPTASWGVIVGAVIRDAATGGNLLFYAPFTESKNTGSGDVISFSPGQLKFTAIQTP